MNTLAEEWKQEGIVIGVQRGELKNARQVLLAIAQDRFDLLPQSVINDIKSIESPETLNEFI